MFKQCVSDKKKTYTIRPKRKWFLHALHNNELKMSSKFSSRTMQIASHLNACFSVLTWHTYIFLNPTWLQACYHYRDELAEPIEKQGPHIAELNTALNTLKDVLIPIKTERRSSLETVYRYGPREASCVPSPPSCAPQRGQYFTHRVQCSTKATFTSG